MIKNKSTQVGNANLLWISLLLLLISVPVFSYWNIPFNLAILAVFVVGLSLWIYSSRANFKTVKPRHARHLHVASQVPSAFEADLIKGSAAPVAGLKVVSHVHHRKARKPKSPKELRR